MIIRSQNWILKREIFEWVTVVSLEEDEFSYRKNPLYYVFNGIWLFIRQQRKEKAKKHIVFHLFSMMLISLSFVLQQQQQQLVDDVILEMHHLKGSRLGFWNSSFILWLVSLCCWFFFLLPYSHIHRLLRNPRFFAFLILCCSSSFCICFPLPHFHSSCIYGCICIESIAYVFVWGCVYPWF